MARRRLSMQTQLSQPAHLIGVLRHHEVDRELSPPLVSRAGRQGRVGRALLLGVFDVADQIDQRIQSRVPQADEAVPNIFPARLPFLFRETESAHKKHVALARRQAIPERCLSVIDLPSRQP